MKSALLFFSLILVVGGVRSEPSPSVESQRALVNQYCVGCHNETVKSGGFSWTEVDLAHPEQSPDSVEKGNPQSSVRNDATRGRPTSG